MMKKLAILGIAAAVMATMVSLPQANAQAEAFNPQGVLKPEPFADVPPDHWAYNAVEQLRQAGLTEGYPDRTFKGKRPMTRYEFARFVQLLLQGLLPKIAPRDVPPPPPAGVTPQQLQDAIAGVQSRILTPEQVRQIVAEEVAKLPKPQQADLSNYVTREQLATVQRLVDEFKDQLARLGVDVDAVKKELADLRGRVEAIEAQLARMPKVTGNLNLIGKTGWKSDQIQTAVGLRPAIDHDGRPLPDTTTMLDQPLAYYDLDLGITARPTAGTRVTALLNVGNYVSSYEIGHPYTVTGADRVRPVHAYFSVPFTFLGANELTVGRQPAQLTPYTFKAVDPDTYTVVPREDSGDVIFWGANTTWRMGQLKLRAFTGINPVDGRLQPLNIYDDPVIAAPAFGQAAVPGGLTNAFGETFGDLAAGFAQTRPIAEVGNFVAARLSYGEPEVGVPAAEQREVAVETTTTTTGAADATVTTETEVESGFSFGLMRNLGVGLNWLFAGARQGAGLPAVPGAQDARAQVLSGDARFNLGPVAINGEVAFGQSQTGSQPRARALDDTAIDVRALYTIGLGFGDLGIGGGWRRVELGYQVPGYWGYLGSWKNPRGIQGWIAQAELPLKGDLASFLRNISLRASGEWYRGAQSLATAGLGAAADPDEKDLNIDRYQAGLAFRLTDRNPVTLGFEQVFRNYVGAAGAAPLSLPTMGVGGSPLVGTRIKNTESYINFGIGHNFTQDIQLALLYQLVDFAKYAVDNSNQPANYRGYVASAQVGVRF